MGRRAKWRDYVDLYFILKDHHDLKEISARAGEIFGAYFNEKLFREQLCFFDDIDHSEKVEYVDDDIDEVKIRNFLVNIATTSSTSSKNELPRRKQRVSQRRINHDRSKRCPNRHHGKHQKRND